MTGLIALAATSISLVPALECPVFKLCDASIAVFRGKDEQNRHMICSWK
jgi:hypothetical protein